MPCRHRHVAPTLAALITVLSGCGSSTPPRTAAGSTAAAAPSSSAPGALAADAASAATGDIPDNQVFLTFAAAKAGFAIRYPEGWTQSSAGTTVTFRDRNNLVRVLIRRGPAPTLASVAAALGALQRTTPGLSFTPPRAATVASGPAVRARYTTQTAPNPVTGRRVTLVVDRYEFARAGRVATVDLGTPVGVDNVDAYRMMIGSFKWT